MLTIDEYKRQDLFQEENHLASFAHVHADLIMGEPKDMEVTIVIPTYGRVHLLREALESCFQQSYLDFQIIIADNEPMRNDETEKLIRSLADERIVYYKNRENIGALANFNRCIELAHSKYCIMLCSDDLLAPDYLEQALAMLHADPDMDMLVPDKDIVYSEFSTKMKGFSTFLRTSKRFSKREPWIRLKPEDFVLYYPAGGPSGIAYLRQSFLEMGGFNPMLHPSGDYIFHILMTLRKKVCLASLHSGAYRMIENITLESNMRTTYVLQNYVVSQQLQEKIGKRSWINRYYGGFAYFKLHRASNKKREVYLDQKAIEEQVPGISLLNFVFFLFIWLFAFVTLPFRLQWRRK